MPYTTPAPSTLNDVFAMNPGAFAQAQDLIRGGMQQNEQDLQASQLANLFKAQNDPQLLQAQGLENQFKQARIPGVQAESDMLGMNRDKQKALYDDSLQAARTKFLAEASEAHLSELEREAQRMAYSKDPTEAAQGEKLLTMHKDMIRERNKQDAQQKRQIELERLRGKNSQELMGMQIQAGRFDKAPAGGSGGGGTIEDQIKSGKLTYEKAATALSGAAFLADLEGDSERANQYRAMADQYNQMFIAGKRAGVQAGAETKPDLSAFDIKTNPPVPAGTFKPVTGTKFSPQAEDWITRAMQANPGMSREQIIEHGKKKGKF